MEQGGLPILDGTSRTSTDNLGGAGNLTAVDIYIEYDFNASGQSITLVDTNGVSVCVNIVTAISHTFTNVDLTGTSPVQITIRSTACGA